VALLARVVLAVVFAFSAVAKLRSRRSLPEAMRAFGVPSPLAGVTAVALPIFELTLALLLVTVRSAWPAWVAVAALALFTVLVVRAAIKHTPCPCFGVVDDAPVGPVAVVRNGVLLAIAVLATAPR
jgi:uncharacterized membrane protein YphA (DoxX/SURF4 family)